MSSATENKTKRIFLAAPHMSGRELEYVKEAFETNYIAPVGPQLDHWALVYSFSQATLPCLASSSSIV